MLNNLRHYLLQEMVRQGKATQQFAVVSLKAQNHDVLAGELASFDIAWALAKNLQDKSGYNQLLIAQGFFSDQKLVDDWQVLCCLLSPYHPIMARQTAQPLLQQLTQLSPAPTQTVYTEQKWAWPLLIIFSLMSIWQWPQIAPLIIVLTLWAFEALIATHILQQAVPESAAHSILKIRPWFYGVLILLSALNLLNFII
jgi:hypothetical protein